MGRTFVSVRQGMKGTMDRWERAGRALQDDGIHVQTLVGMAKKHSSESFYGFSDPDEAAVFSVFVDMIRALGETGVDP